MKKKSEFGRYLILGLGLFLISTLTSLAEPKRGGDYILPAAQFPPHFNSAIQSGVAVATPASQIFVSLVLINENWEPVPYLAKSWNISADGMTYTFNLREGTVFHDGKPVTSKDVAFSLGVSKNNHPFGRYMFGAVDRVETPDKYTAVIKLKQPHPALLIAVTLPLMPILPEHVYGEAKGRIRRNKANIKAIGSGPFKVKEFVAGKSYILERFDEFMYPGRPYLDRFIAKKITSPSAALIAISRGEIHAYSDGDPQIIRKMKANKMLRVTDRGFKGIGAVDFIEFNLRKKYVKDKRVRQAIAYAIDRDFITKRLHRGLTRIATGPIPSGSPFYTSIVNQYRIDLEKANRILDDAGYKRGSDGMRFELNLIYMPAMPYAQKMIAEYMKPQLKKIGIKINLKAPADFMNWYMTLAKWQHDISTSNVFLWGDPVIGTHRMFMSTNIKHQVWTNTCGYVNKEVDKILEEAAVERNLMKRKALYAEFQRIVADDLPYYFTIEDTFHTAYHKDLMDTPIGIWGGPWDQAYWKDGKTP
ncbi:MAG: ABC transporter substrate-binding protein [Proteobacteria bacterium]|nr:ABC transporter substrate-binding protein [Pseudomonadota bacterium]